MHPGIYKIYTAYANMKLVYVIVNYTFMEL